MSPFFETKMFMFVEMSRFLTSSYILKLLYNVNVIYIYIHTHTHTHTCVYRVFHDFRA